MKLHPAAIVVLLALGAPLGFAQTSRNDPLDFSYRVQGDGRIAPLVFNDGNDIYVQPDHSQLGDLRVLDAPFAQEGPYVVVRGLRERFTLAWKGATTTVNYTAAASPVAQPPLPPALQLPVTAPCKPGVEMAETTYPVVFSARSSRLSSAFLEQLPAIAADAKTAAAVTVVGRPDTSDAQFAERRARAVRAALLAQGVPEALIHIETRTTPENGSELVVSRRQETSCPATPRDALAAIASETAAGRSESAAVAPRTAVHASPTPADVKPAANAAIGKAGATASAALDPATAAALALDSEHSKPVPDEDRRKAVQQVAALVQAGKITQSMGAQLISAANRASPAEAAIPPAFMTSTVPPTLPAAAAAQAMPATGVATLTFVPNSSVRRVLRAYLRERGIELDWHVQGDLIVEEFAAIPGTDMKDVIQTALRRLGLKGTLVAGRLLIVEAAS